MVYNNNFKFLIKTLSKELPINIFQLSKTIECKYNILEYSQKTRYIDIDLKLVMKHFFIQSYVDYINSIFFKKNLSTNNLGFFTNMSVMKGLTSAPAIDLLNVNSNKIEKINSTFFAYKKICGVLGDQYLSPITTFIFIKEWNKLTEILKYEKILNYDKTFLLNLNNNMQVAADSLWDGKMYYNNYNSFLSSFKELLEFQYWIHNFGDFKLYKYPNNFYSYPEIYQILYNLDFKFNKDLDKYKILFDSIFFDKFFIDNQNLNLYKNFSEFNSQVSNWRESGKIIKYIESSTFLILMEKKFKIDDFSKIDLTNSFLKIFKNLKTPEQHCFLILIEKNKINKFKLKKSLLDKNLLFFYYIPSNEIKIKDYDYLLIGFSKLSYKYIINFFCDCSIIEGENNIVNYLVDNINWKSTDLYNHYLWWDENNQLPVSSYLDFISGGLVCFLPETWN